MAYEHMTKKEIEQLHALQAKQKRVQRAEEEFLKEADARKAELAARWGMSDRMQKAAEIIDTDIDALFDWITSDAQVAFFRRNHPHEATCTEPSDTGDFDK